MKPRLEDINEKTLVKLRGGEMVVLLSCTADTKHFYDKENIQKSHRTGLANFKWYETSLKYDELGPIERRDIVAIKQCESQSQAIAAVLSGAEPAWDWTEEQERRPQKGDWVEYFSDRYGTPRNKQGKGIVETIEDEHALVKTECGGTLMYYFNELRLIDPPAPVVLPAADVLRELSPKYGPRISIKFDGQTVEL